ncbi:MAG: type 4a pilus biogenesis protein PilO [Phycisphaerae bacterium]|nr:type 4a pilus biogenesis protein PilO [Phycisphaerae bacterium]
MNLRRNWKIDGAAVAMIVAAAGLFYWLGVSPVVSLREQRTAQQSQLDAQKRTVAQNAARLNEVKQALASTRKTFDDLAVHLEPAANINTRISRLTELAGQNKLKIDEVHPAEPVYGPDYGSVPIVLDGSGTFGTWAAFLRDLAKSFPDTAVDTFQLTRKSDELSSPVQFHVNLVWYVSPQAPAAAPAQAAAPH